MRYFTIEECTHSATVVAEDKSGLPKWMHVGYKYTDGVQQRGEFRSMINGNYCSMTQ